ncbi:MAG TPA: hypothetical protein VGI53_07425 [Dyella sp.]
MTTIYRGTLRKGDEPGIVVGSIQDEWGWAIELRGTLDPATREYVLVGTLAEVPDALRVDAIDGPKKAAAE